MKNWAIEHPVASAAGSFSLGGVVGAVGYFALDSFCRRHNSAGIIHQRSLIDHWKKSIGEDPDSSSTIGAWLV